MRHVPLRRPVPFAALVIALALVAGMPAGFGGLASTPGPVGAYRELDGSIVARNILPPGQGQHLNALDFVRYNADESQPDHNTDQLAMYENLIREAPTLTDDDLDALFKDASFGVAPGDVGRVYAPRNGTTVVRDLSYNVPHVYGATRYDTMFGAGYVSAEDRLFMMDVLRHLARGRLSEMLGASDDNLDADRAQRTVADYSEDELLAMGFRLQQIDPELGQLASDDLNAFTSGVNAYITEALADPTKLPAEYPALQQVPLPWKTTDSIALATLIGGQFSVGGGGQLGNDAFLDALETEHDDATARAIFNDFRNANDPEAPVNTATAFPFNQPASPVDPASVARPDNPDALTAAAEASLLPPVIDGPFGPIRLADPEGASNALMIGPQISSTGRPLAVFGPQVSYYAPEILMELDLHGPGVHARGAAFPGISLYVLLGRGTDYAWSATTAIGDHIDIRAVELCNPDGSAPAAAATNYLDDGVCKPMVRRTDTWLAKPTAGGVPESPTPDRIAVQMTTERTRHGIVASRGTVGGAPVAFVRQRSSYGKEVDATLTFVAIHDPARIGSIDDLLHAFGDYFTFSFNWHLITGDDMGFITTGLYPVLADGVDGDLPFWGDSQWDAQRTLTFAEHPQAVSPDYITNWNNKQAPQFRASDDWYAYGSVQRKMLLTDGVEAALQDDGKVSMTELVQAMGIAATRDLRGAKVLPYILQIIGAGDTPAQQQALDLLSAWTADGAHRRDLDGDGFYDESAAVALMDALWEPSLRAAFEPTLGDAYALIPFPHDNPPGPGGSSYLGGLYGQLHKDLRSVLGVPVVSPYSRLYCGGGDAGACRTAMLSALDQARAAVEMRFNNSADPGTWDVPATCEQDDSCEAIRFEAVGVVEERRMMWQNRPTFQQMLEFMPS